jgi:anti-sigma-K factor RskA
VTATIAGRYTSTTLEAIPATPGVYLVSLIGAAGSGVVQATIGVDATNSYLILRRLTAGTTNTFNAKVWRLDP